MLRWLHALCSDQNTANSAELVLELGLSLAKSPCDGKEGCPIFCMSPQIVHGKVMPQFCLCYGGSTLLVCKLFSCPPIKLNRNFQCTFWEKSKDLSEKEMGKRKEIITLLIVATLFCLKQPQAHALHLDYISGHNILPSKF